MLKGIGPYDAGLVLPSSAAIFDWHIRGTPLHAPTGVEGQLQRPVTRRREVLGNLRLRRVSVFNQAKQINKRTSRATRAGLPQSAIGASWA